MRTWLAHISRIARVIAGVVMLAAVWLPASSLLAEEPAAHSAAQRRSSEYRQDDERRPPNGYPKMVEVAAPIESVEILTTKSSPPHYDAHVVYGLPDGCTKPGGYSMARDGDTIFIEVWNLRPADPNVVCTMIYSTGEYTIGLGSDFTSGHKYTVIVNDTSTTFTAQ